MQWFKKYKLLVAKRSMVKKINAMRQILTAIVLLNEYTSMIIVI